MSKKLLSQLHYKTVAWAFTTAIIGNLWGCGEPRSNETNAQSNTQHDFTITVNKAETGPDRVQLFVELENRGKETVYFYDVNTEIWQGEKRYEPKRTFQSTTDLPSEVPPGSRVDGVILFPKLAPGGNKAVIRFQAPSNETNNNPWDPVEFRWPLPFPSASQSSAPTTASVRITSAPKRIAIIKADDMTALSPNWDRFLDVSAKRNIKVSIGIICESLQEDKTDYFEWLRARHNSKEVEFWNHGWDHQRLGEGRAISEYSGSGYEYQKKHLTDSQEFIQKIIGEAPVALGTPWNEFDRDTVRVVNEDKNIHLFFGHKEGVFEQGKVVVRMLQSEADGTGKPNFNKFKTLYKSQKDQLDVIALQFHPLGFDERSFTEYERILDFLLIEGWTFMLPREYLKQINL